MSARFAELDWCETPIGVLSLRRRFDPLLNVEVYEVKLGDEFLMSSLFTAGEIALAEHGLAALAANSADVAVGGLGLGYTARAVLRDSRVRSMVVVDALDAVIDWHQRQLLPDAVEVTSDQRARLVHGDFFVMAAQSGFDPDAPDRRFHAILLDVDHSPSQVLDPSHARCYTPDGLRSIAEHLHPGGVFALWSDDPPEERFSAALAEVFPTTRAHVVTFPNPFTGGEAANTVYVAVRD